MKELSVEEKAKRYDKALEKAKDMLSYKEVRQEDMEYLFPELKENEDERIRKELIQFIENWKDSNNIGRPHDFPMFTKNVEQCDKYIAWLEKQGEQKPIINFKSTDWYVSKVDGKIHNIYYSVDNVKPKFKVGDWITDGDLHCKISDILDVRYIVDTKFTKERFIPFKFENKYHLWTIEDAKDGDVLASDQVVFIFKKIHGVWLDCYCSSHNDGSFIAVSYDLLTDKYFGEVYPATKEQHGILFQKMKEKGYEWNEETLDLKKIDIVR